MMPAKPTPVMMLLDNPFRSDNRVAKEAQALLDAGYAVTVVAERDDELPAEEQRDGITIIRLFEPLLKQPGRAGYARYLNHVADQLAGMPMAVLHCHDYFTLPVGARIRQRQPNLPLVYDAHEFIHGLPFYKLLAGWSNRLKGYMVWRKLIRQERQHVHAANLVIVPSPYLSEALQRHLRLPAPPLVIRNIPALAAPENEAPTTALHDHFNLPPGERFIVHSGKINLPDDDLDAFFDAVANMPQLKMVFLGNYARYFSLKEKISRDERLRDQILFHPYGRQADNIRVMASATLGLSYNHLDWSSHRYSFPNRIVEYFYAGLPVLGTATDFCREMASDHGIVTLYRSHDAASIHSALEKALANASEARITVSQIRHNFAWPNERERLLDAYRKLT